MSVGASRQFFTKSFLGDDAADLAQSSGEGFPHPTPSSRRRVDGVEDDRPFTQLTVVKGQISTQSPTAAEMDDASQKNLQMNGPSSL